MTKPVDHVDPSDDDPTVDDPPVDDPYDDHDQREEPPLQAGLDHLQRAAHEVIAASRALLDVVEDLVDDPHAASTLADMFSSVTALAGRIGRGGGSGSAADSADEGDDDPPVQRIPVS